MRFDVLRLVSDDQKREQIEAPFTGEVHVCMSRHDLVYIATDVKRDSNVRAPAAQRDAALGDGGTKRFGRYL